MLTVLPLVFGIPIGVVAGSFVFRAFVQRIGALPDPAIPILLLLGMAAVLVGVANIAAIVPTRRARRLSTAALLQAE